MPQEPIYLEDVSIGAEYRSETHLVERDQVFSFARQFDPQPFHLDADAADKSLFQGLAASGWHTAALTMRLLVDSVPLANGLIGAGADLSWPRPTRPGDTLQVVSKVLEIAPSRSKSDRGIVTVECLTMNQHGEVCQRMVSKLVVMRKPE